MLARRAVLDDRSIAGTTAPKIAVTSYIRCRFSMLMRPAVRVHGRT
jgi:nucleoside diphosphate kinase